MILQQDYDIQAAVCRECLSRLVYGVVVLRGGEGCLGAAQLSAAHVLAENSSDVYADNDSALAQYTDIVN